MFNSHLIHDVKHRIPVRKIRTPGKSASRRNRPGTGISLPFTSCSLQVFSIAIASAVVWNVTTSFNSFFLMIQSLFQIQSLFRHGNLLAFILREFLYIRSLMRFAYKYLYRLRRSFDRLAVSMIGSGQESPLASTSFISLSSFLIE